MQAHPSDLIFRESCSFKPPDLLEVGRKSSALKVSAPKVSALKASAPKVSVLKVSAIALLLVAFDPKSVLFKNGVQFRRLQGFSLSPL